MFVPEVFFMINYALKICQPLHFEHSRVIEPFLTLSVQILFFAKK